MLKKKTLPSGKPVSDYHLDDTRQEGWNLHIFRGNIPFFHLVFHFLSRLPMICSDFPDSYIRFAR
jgi:hypothetical protein